MRRCPGGVAWEDTRTMPGGEPISLAGLALSLQPEAACSVGLRLVVRFAVGQGRRPSGSVPCCGSSVSF